MINLLFDKKILKMWRIDINTLIKLINYIYLLKLNNNILTNKYW